MAVLSGVSLFSKRAFPLPPLSVAPPAESTNPSYPLRTRLW
jgi:hypothetical protein